jgi:hypothetical protein
VVKRASITQQRRTGSSLEAALDRFVGSLDPSELLRSIDALASEDAARIPALLLRSGIVQTMRDEDRAARRDAALEALVAKVRDMHGSDAAAYIERAVLLIVLVERGYQALSDELDQMLADATPEDWLWAILDHAAELIDWSLGEIDRRAAATRMVDGSVFALPDGAGGEFRADELMAMVDGTTSVCIRTLAARQGWHDGEGAVIFPDRPAGIGDAPDAVRLSRLSEFWELWRRMETGARFLDCELREEYEQGETIRTLTPTRDALDCRRLAHVAHEQLTVEIDSVFNQLIYREDAHRDAVDIDDPAPLMPNATVTASEVYSYHALEMLLAVAPVEDTSQYLGLTLVEWLRGYAVIERIASRASRSEGPATRFLVTLDEGELVDRLVRLGLSPDKARRFIDNVTFRRGSGDIVDDPILRTADGGLLLFGPLICNCEITRTILSKFARRNVRIGSKGKRFERRFREQLSDWGLRPVHGEVRDVHGPYEVDAAIRLDRRVFLFECKTRSSFGVEPANVWRLREWMSRAAAQARRIAEGLERNPASLGTLLGEGGNRLEVIPCVVGALPLQARGMVDGAYFTDQMALAMFFAIGEAGVYTTHRIPGLPPLRQTIFAKPLWSGRSPSSDDLLRHLADPPSAAMVGAHIREVEVSERLEGVGTFRTVEMEARPADSALSIAALGGVGIDVVGPAMLASERLSSIAERIRR